MAKNIIENHKRYLKARDLWAEVMLDVMRTKAEDVGPVIANGDSLKEACAMGASKDPERRQAGLSSVEDVCGPTDNTVKVWVSIAKFVKDCVEMEVLEIDESLKDIAAQMWMEQMSHVVRTPENLLAARQDLDAINKMLGGFSVDRFKKSGSFEVPWLGKCRQYLTVQWRKNEESNTGLRLISGTKKEIEAMRVQPTHVTKNGLAFWKAERKTKAVAKVGRRKKAILDDTSRCLEEAFDLIGDAFLEFFGSMSLPRFSEPLKDFILKSLAKKPERGETNIFLALFLVLRYFSDIWNSMTSWKKWSLAEARRENEGSLDPDEEAAIKGAASNGFRDVREDIRRGATTYVKNNPMYLATVALAVAYMDKDGLSWVEDEAEAGNFARSALAEEYDLLMWAKMKKAGKEVTEYAIEELHGYSGISEGQVLNFTDGKAIILDKDENKIGFAKVAMNKKINGNWEVFIGENGKFCVRKNLKDALTEIIPQGNFKKRVFISTIPENRKVTVNTMGNVLKKAQLNGTEVHLVDVANYRCGNAEVHNAVVVDNEIIGEYRVPRFQRLKEERERLCNIVGGVRGKVERQFSYRTDDGNWVTICVLEEVYPLTKAQRYPKGVTDRRAKDEAAEAARKAHEIKQQESSVAELNVFDM